jgi:hypothetical protein
MAQPVKKEIKKVHKIKKVKKSFRFVLYSNCGSRPGWIPEQARQTNPEASAQGGLPEPPAANNL